ncbi:MAG: N-acetyltransferase [Chitinophagaceae bacterium]|nr:MAG: N-acetyltransferase [Chitinophagaceae bacterium]
MEVTIHQQETKGFAMVRDNGKRAGAMTFSIASPELIIIDHTEVETEYNGKGIGKLLLYKIVDMAREKNIKILPLCPYAAAQFKKIAEIRDVLRDQ